VLNANSLPKKAATPTLVGEEAEGESGGRLMQAGTVYANEFPMTCHENKTPRSEQKDMTLCRLLHLNLAINLAPCVCPTSVSL